MPAESPVCIHWFRRDLRLDDNAALYHALRSGLPVQAVFIFDRGILDRLADKADRRVVFIYRQLERLQEALRKTGGSLDVRYGEVKEVWKELLKDYAVKAVYANHDYEPYARERDAGMEQLLKKEDVKFHTFKDQVIFEKDEVLKDDGKPYTVYTPYSRKWMAGLNAFYLRSYPCEKYHHHFYRQQERKLPALSSMGFRDAGYVFPAETVSEELLRHYAETRDLPGIAGTSRLSVHLRFGTVSIRKLATMARSISPVWLNELCWREFYMMILWHFPYVAQSAFKPAYNHIPWRNDEKEFDAWCRGQTGYPIVDAGMRELSATGFMHNRVRMVVASFLTKHLLIDWRWGEAWFAQKLLDFDLSANNGGWQWAAGSGCDAAPYFRIFNPYEQTRRFDPGLKYIRQWVPEHGDFSYPQPIVDHKLARERCLSVYKKALGSPETS
ncbi:MAG: deoxyribodipyrimidine photo-lyase [Bacteroidia bacterium]|nr:deoxyribodipyrimidine photo-lyase [Bacteroidia bacterium]